MRLHLRFCTMALALLFSVGTSVKALEYMYVTTSSNTIVRFDISVTNQTAMQNSILESGNTFDSTALGVTLSNPRSISMNNTNGTIYVSNQGTSEILKFDSSLTKITPALSASAPYGVGVDGSGNLFAVNFGAALVNQYAGGSGSANSFTDSSTGGLAGPTGLTVSSNYVWVANNNGTITAYNPTDSAMALAVKTVTLSGTGHDLRNMAVGSDGYVYIADYSNDTNSTGDVWKFNPNEASPSATAVTGVSLTNPTGIAFDRGGNMYVSNYNDLGTTGSISFLRNPTWGSDSFTINLASGVQPLALVPEPSTYALSLVASGMLAFAARRRKGSKPINRLEA